MRDRIENFAVNLAASAAWTALTTGGVGAAVTAIAAAIPGVPPWAFMFAGLVAAVLVLEGLRSLRARPKPIENQALSASVTSEAERARLMDHLITLRQVGIHFLQNRPVDTDAAEERLLQDFQTWEAMVLPPLQRIAQGTQLRPLDIDRFVNLGDFNPMLTQEGRSLRHADTRGYIAEKVRRLEALMNAL